MYLRLGRVRAVVLSSPSVVEEAFKNHDSVLLNRTKFAAAATFFYNYSDISFTTYGDYWRQARRIVVMHLLSTKRVQSFGSVRDQEVSLLIEKMRSLSSSHGVVNFSQLLYQLTNDILCRAALGQKLSDDGTSEAGDLVKDMNEILGEVMIGDGVPCLSWLDWLNGTKKKMMKTHKAFDKILENLIEARDKARKNAPRDGKDGDGNQKQGRALVDVMLEIQENNEDGVSLTRDNIKGILTDTIIPGTDSIFTALDWTMAELMNNPKEFKRVQEEVRGVINAEGKLTEEVVDKMAYLNCAIKEAFRLHIPFPLLVRRESTEAIELMGYHIPVGTRFIIAAWAMGRDPKFWERGDEYMPQRFLDSDVDFWGQHYAFLPFGTGKRSCPGIGFGTTIIGFALASLLHHFDFNLPDGMKGKPLDMTEINGLALRRKLDLVLEAKPRST